jgi:prolycopene isomerase
LLEDWQNMELAEGTIFVSIPTLLDADLAYQGYHIIHAFTPAWIADWQELTPTEYEQKKEQTAAKIIQRLENIFPTLYASLDYLEVGTPLSHRRFLGRIDGSYGPIPKHKFGDYWECLLIVELYLYCVGDRTFPDQGLNVVAFCGFACAHRIAVDLGL